MNYDLILKNGQCFINDPKHPGQLIEEATDIGIKNGMIEEIGTIPKEDGDQVLDVSGLTVLPGLIDTQVHFREPGLEHKENIASGSRGALMGGLTGFFEMPNTKPSTEKAIDLEDKLNRAKQSSWTHYAFYIGATGDNTEQLAQLEKHPGCPGVKMFMGSSTGGLLVDTDEGVESVVMGGQKRMAVHCEDEPRLRERAHIAKDHPNEPQYHAVWRDEESALRATQRLIRLAEKHRRPVHVLHVTTAEEMEFLKGKKQVASVEVTPQHLTLSAPECYEKLGTFAQMNPPIRDKRHQEALWAAVNNGTVDILGSDHAPHTVEEKKRPYPKSPSGLVGVQTTLPLMLNHIHQGRLTLNRLIELMCLTPCRLFGIRQRGGIQKGHIADFSIVDLKAQRTITTDWIQSKSGWTPFEGMEIMGWPKMAILNGQVCMRDDELIGGPKGQMIEFD